MKVKELIEQLLKVKPNADVFIQIDKNLFSTTIRIVNRIENNIYPQEADILNKDRIYLQDLDS